MENHKYDWDSNYAISAVMHDFRLGKESAFEVVFKELYKTMFYFCDNIIDNDQEAEDICLIAFQGLFRRCHEFDAERNIMAFLTVSIRNRCISYARNKKNRQKRESLVCMEDIDTTLVDRLNKEDELLARGVITAMTGIPKESKRVLTMLLYKEADPKKLARMLNITQSAVNSHKNIALREIKSYLYLSSEETKRRIFNKYNSLCAYTGRPLGADWIIDHLEPYMYHHGGDFNGDDNLMPAIGFIQECKKGRSVEKFRSYLLTFHKKLKKLTKTTHKEIAKKRKEYALMVAEVFNITPDKPFSGKFFFEKQ